MRNDPEVNHQLLLSQTEQILERKWYGPDKKLKNKLLSAISKHSDSADIKSARWVPSESVFNRL